MIARLESLEGTYLRFLKIYHTICTKQVNWVAEISVAYNYKLFSLIQGGGHHLLNRSLVIPHHNLYHSNLLHHHHHLSFSAHSYDAHRCNTAIKSEFRTKSRD